MKKTIIFVLAAFGMSLIAGAQSQITNQTLVQEGKKAVVSFDIETSDNSIPSKRKEVIMPYIYNGADTLWLETVEVYGKNRYKREKQENLLAGNKEWTLGEGQTMKGSTYSYKAEAPLKKWMSPANLGIRTQIVGCACENDLSDKDIASAQLFNEPEAYKRPAPVLAVVDPDTQWNFGQDELEIIFKRSRIQIDSTVFNNEVTFGKILTAVDKIMSNPNLRVEKIQVAGYASPEGEPGFNTWLGKNRALALIDYIIKQRPEHNLTRDNFEIVNGDENWAGLRRLTLASELTQEEKDAIVAVIDSDKGIARKDMLKKINYGHTYLRMIDLVYPHLRCARYLAVFYSEKDTKAVEAILRANELVRKGDANGALKELEPFRDDYRTLQTAAVAEAMNGQYEKAIEMMTEVLGSGDKAAADAAQANINTIRAELDKEAKFLKEREAYLSQFE